MPFAVEPAPCGRRPQDRAPGRAAAAEKKDPRWALCTDSKGRRRGGCAEAAGLVLLQGSVTVLTEAVARLRVWFVSLDAWTKPNARSRGQNPRSLPATANERNRCASLQLSKTASHFSRHAGNQTDAAKAAALIKPRNDRIELFLRGIGVLAMDFGISLVVRPPSL